MATLDGGWRRLVTEIGVEFMSDRALELFRAGRAEGRGQRRPVRPGLPAGAGGARRPASFDVQARNPANTVHIGDDAMVFGSVYGPPFVREGDVRRDAKMDDFRNFAKLAQSFAAMDSAGGIDLRAGGHAAGLPAPRHDLRAADAHRQDLHGQRRVRRERAATPCAMTEILFGGRETIETDARHDLADQLQLAAALGRPHARRAVRVLRGEPGRGDHAVPADGGHVAGVDPGRR